MEKASDSGLICRSVSTGDIGSDAHATSATLHALPGASGSWTALTHTGAHHSHVRDLACFSVAGVLAHEASGRDTHES